MICQFVTEDVRTGEPAWIVLPAKVVENKVLPETGMRTETLAGALVADPRVLVTVR